MKMKHAQEKYNEVQDGSGRIPEDEPVFLLRGQDELAPSVIRYWVMCLAENTRGKPTHAQRLKIRAALDQADAMERWEARKIPGTDFEQGGD